MDGIGPRHCWPGIVPATTPARIADDGEALESNLCSAQSLLSGGGLNANQAENEMVWRVGQFLRLRRVAERLPNSFLICLTDLCAKFRKLFGDWIVFGSTPFTAVSKAANGDGLRERLEGME